MKFVCEKNEGKRTFVGKIWREKKMLKKKFDKQISFNIICVWRVNVSLQKADYTLLDGLFFAKTKITTTKTGKY